MQISVDQYLTHHYPVLNQMPKMIKSSMVSLAKRFFHEDEVNDFIQNAHHKDRFSFIESILDYFDINIELTKNQLDNIPSYGKVVIIANHPLGALDAMALIHLLKDVRKDIKIVANSFLSNIEHLSSLLIPIDNIQGKMDKEALKGIYDALKNEEAVIIFPSGEVSRARPTGIKDTPWKSGFLKIASKLRAPILPIFIDAKNSSSFYFVSMLNRNLATATLPHEMFKSKGKNIKFTIGKSIPFESYGLSNIPKKEQIKLFRKHFYRVAKGRRELFKTQNEISMPESRSEIKSLLKEGELLGETFDGKKIILYQNEVEDAVLKEIGRLREISFRFVGEGSGKKRDIDEYDFYYNHLVIWDDEALQIAGAYRVGFCNDIYEDFGLEGLYTSNLFEFKEEFERYMPNSIELGRSFVQPKYWNTRALDYLWQGIGALVKKRQDIRYLFGAVSMSDHFSNEAKSALVYFYSHYFNPKEQIIKHKYPFEMPSELKKRFEHIFSGDNYKEDFRRLKDELSFMGFVIPTLYKQYSEICEEGGVRFFDFGYDSQFNNCVDGFILTDLTMLKESKRKRYMGE